MSNVKKYRPLIKRLKKLGYKVFLVFMEIPKEESIKRALKRYQDNNAKTGEFGRYVPISVIEDFYGTGDEAFQLLKKEVDGYIKVDGIKQLIEERGGMQLPENRSYAGLGTNILPKVEKVIETAKPTNKVDFTEKRLKALKISLRFSKDKAMVEKRIKALEISLKVLAMKKTENSSVEKPKANVKMFKDKKFDITYKVQPSTKQADRFEVVSSSPKWEEDTIEVFVSEEDAVNHAKLSAGILKEEDPEKGFMNKNKLTEKGEVLERIIGKTSSGKPIYQKYYSMPNLSYEELKEASEIQKTFAKKAKSEKEKQMAINYAVAFSRLANENKFVKGLGDLGKSEAKKPTFVESNLLKELNKLQRDLNSSRLSTYNEGDDSDEAKALRRERESKLTRFNEVLATLNELDSKKMAKGGSVSDQEIFEQQFGKM
jgi:hypothetical protein